GACGQNPAATRHGSGPGHGSRPVLAPRLRRLPRRVSRAGARSILAPILETRAARPGSGWALASAQPEWLGEMAPHSPEPDRRRAALDRAEPPQPVQPRRALAAQIH